MFTKEGINIKNEMPAPIFKSFGEIPSRTPESPQIYRGQKELVPDIMKLIFPDTDFSKLTPAQVDIKLKIANSTLRGMSFSRFGDPVTAKIVVEDISMAYRTHHPLAFKRLESEMRNTLRQMNKKGSGVQIPIVDVGYGPGTISMAFYDLAMSEGFKPSLSGVDLSPVNQAVAQYLYPTNHYNVDWSVGNGEQLPFTDGQFRIGSAFDVGHHLEPGQYQNMIDELIRCSREHILVTDPTNSIAARKIVGLITAKDQIKEQAVNSYNAAYSRRDLSTICGCVIGDNPNVNLNIDLINTGFMNVIHLRRN